MKKRKHAADTVESNDYLLDSNIPFIVNEAYNALRTNIIFSMPGEGCKTIGVTSANRGDGKSSVALNLAISLAQLGKKVILLDCDLRLPTIAKKLGIKAVPGMTDMLVGEVKIEQCLRMIDSFGITVLPSGNIPPDATRLLDSERFRKMIGVLRSHYDYILLDFPPVKLVSDALIARDVTDGYVLLVHHGQTEMNEIAEMVSKMRMAEANLLGFVYPSAPISEKKRYGYYK